MSRRYVLPLSLLFLATVTLRMNKDQEVVLANQSAAQPMAPIEVPVVIDRLDGLADGIVPAHAKLEKVATGFLWTEGPVWLPTKQLLFADIPSNSIREWDPAKTKQDGVSIFLQPSGYKGADAYGGPEPGSNGMTLDREGRLTVAGHAQRDVWRFESISPDAKITVLADSYHGKRLNSPNDLVYRSDGSLYFTDPPYGLRTQSETDPEKEQPVSGVYRIPGASAQRAGSAPARRELQLLVTDLPRPNGLAFSPDEKYLYVDNSEPEMLWMRYPVHTDGSLGTGEVFYRAGRFDHHGAPDGMKVDQHGNLYSAGPGGVWIFSPEGKHIVTINMPEIASNLAWGGRDSTMLYITASTSVYRIQLKVPGIYPHTK